MQIVAAHVHVPATLGIRSTWAVHGLGTGSVVIASGSAAEVAIVVHDVGIAVLETGKLRASPGAVPVLAIRYQHGPVHTDVVTGLLVRACWNSLCHRGRGQAEKNERRTKQAEN